MLVFLAFLWKGPTLSSDEDYVEKGIDLFVKAQGIPGGLKLMLVPTVSVITAKSLEPFHGEDMIYIVLGGLVLVLVSYRGIVRAFRQPRSGQGQKPGGTG